MGFIGKKELYTILCAGYGDYSSDSLELNADITPDFVVRSIDRHNFVYKIEVLDGSTLIREFGFPKLESEVVYVITPTWIFKHENYTLKIVGSSESLPDISDANIGDVLTVGENGNVVWSTPSGGGGDGLKLLGVETSNFIGTSTVTIAPGVSNTISLENSYYDNILSTYGYNPETDFVLFSIAGYSSGVTGGLVVAATTGETPTIIVYNATQNDISIGTSAFMLQTIFIMRYVE